MNIQQALQTRKSVRAFLDKGVDRDLIENVLDLSRFYPSSTNMQPIEVCVLRGNAKKTLDQKLLKAFDDGVERHMDYEYYPKVQKDIFMLRQQELGKSLYNLLGISRDDKDARVKQWRKNYEAFGAPVVLYFFMDKSLKSSSFIDCGILLQSIMLTATEFGLSTCVQGSLGEYPNIVRKELGIASDKILICGMAMGYADEDATINSFQSTRIGLDEFCRFYD